MLLAAIGLSLSLLLGASGPALLSAQATPGQSQLPATQPGLSRNEGIFLVTAADDGSRLVYFIAQNTRHSTLPGDLQLEQQLNSLWPVRLAGREEVLAFPEAAPVGSARAGLLSGPAVAESDSTADEAPAAVAEAPAAPEVYVLRPGDNLIRLSARFSTTVAALLEANGLTNANRIYSGAALTIPGAGPIAVVADEQDHLADMPANPDAVTYTVKAGDSAIHIARQFGVEVDALLTANGVANRNRVYIGQILDIPGG